MESAIRYGMAVPPQAFEGSGDGMELKWVAAVKRGRMARVTAVGLCQPALRSDL